MSRIFLNIFIFLMLVIIPFFSIAKDTILLIGDSLSAGYGLAQEQAWVHLLQNKYQAENIELNIINAAVSGQTTDNALLNIEKLLKAHQPNLVLIELGGNDGLRGFPIGLIEKHLFELVTISQKNKANVALMEINIPPNLGPRYSKMFAENYSKVASKTDAYLMPFFMTNIATVSSLMQDDNLHPNAKAQGIISEFMYTEINKWLSSIK